MTWATKRKLSYLGVFFFLLAILIGVPAYKILYKPPTCFDYKQNQNEDGVDCGGPCVSLCRPLELLPVVLWQQTFEVIPGTYTAVAYIDNPNLNAESFNVPYTLTVYGESNVVLAKRTGNVYIPPGKNFGVFESNIKLGTQMPVRTDFTFDGPVSWKAATKKPDIKVRNTLVSNTTTASPSIDADIENESLTNIPRVVVTAIVYDPEGNAFASSRTVVDHLDAQTSQHVVFTWPNPFVKTATRVEIIPIIQ